MKKNHQPLPITGVISDLKKTLATGRNAVLCAPPGAGKTTGVPPALLDSAWLGNQKIIMLEPRRLATRAAAHRMSDMMGEAVGQTVGYRMRQEKQVSRRTRIEVVTEGVLTRQIQHDPGLTDIGIVIFDEFHERSLHADTGLALCLDVQTGLRENLRLLVMSATLDTGAISRLLHPAPIIQSTGRQFPVTTRYWPGSSAANRTTAVSGAILKALSEERGSILVFLPGAREIRQVANRLSTVKLDPSIQVAPLYGGLPRPAQDLAIQPAPPGHRKIVLATAIAETSLTIEGIRVVIDSGEMRVPRFDVRSAMTRLATIPVTRDTAHQRRGRAGRLEPGICYRLWSEETNRVLTAHSPPEIHNADLASLALELAVWGVTDPADLAWIDPPPTAAFAQARGLLSDLGALDTHGRITAAGKHMATLGLHPRLAHMIHQGIRVGLGALACELAALLSERDVLRLPRDQQDADISRRVAVLRSTAGNGHRGTQDPYASVSACRRVWKTAQRLKSRLNCHDRDRKRDECGLLLAFAYPDRVASRRPGDAPRYHLSNGRGAYFSGAEPLSAENYLVAASLDGVGQEARIFLAAAVSYETLTDHFSRQITECARVDWDRPRQAVRFRRQVLFGKAVLKDFPLANPDPDQVTEAMCVGIRRMGLSVLPWTKRLRTWQARVMQLRQLDECGDDWPDVSDGHLADTLDDWLRPYLNGITQREHLRKLDLSSALNAMLSWKQQLALDQLAPTHFTVPSGSKIPIDYTTAEHPLLAVRLQEMFGATRTPRIAGGKLPLLIHLLSPAGRPVQVTRDLKSFWNNAYYEVKKDLKGRYPKHYWPDNPLRAQATNRAKKRT